MRSSAERDRLFLAGGQKVGEVFAPECARSARPASRRRWPILPACGRRLDRRERRHVPDHRQRAVFRDAAGTRPSTPSPFSRPASASRAFQPVLGDAVGARLRDHLRIVRIEEDRQLRFVEILLVLGAGRFLDAVRVIEHDAEIADAADAGFRAHRRLAGLDARIAEDALLRLAARPVVIDLLVGAARHAHAPAAAFVLVDEHDAVFLALVDRAGRTGGDAGRVEAVLAQPRQIHHEGVFELAVDVLLHAFEIVVLRALGEFAAEDFLPVRAPFDLLHALAGDQRARTRGRHRRHFRRFLQVLVVEGERLVVVVDLRQIGIGEDVGQHPPFRRRCAARSCRCACARQPPFQRFWFSQSFG